MTQDEMIADILEAIEELPFWKKVYLNLDKTLSREEKIEAIRFLMRESK